MASLLEQNVRGSLVTGPALVATLVISFSIFMRPFPEFRYWIGVTIVGLVLAAIGASRWVVAAVILLAGLCIVYRTELLDWENHEFSHRPQQLVSKPESPS
jgi:hypothetical protein